MNKITELTRKEQKKIEKTINDLREMLLNTKELILDGKAATPQMIEKILESAREGIINSMLKRKEEI